MVRSVPGSRITTPPPKPKRAPTQNNFARTVHIDVKKAIEEYMFWSRIRERDYAAWIVQREAASIEHCSHVEVFRYRMIGLSNSESMLERAKAKLLVLGLV